MDQAIVRGSELLKQGKLEQAQRAFRAALDIDPHSPKVLALLGLAHFRANEFDAARPIYEQLVELAPTDASHRLNLGLVYLKLNDAAHAIGALEASRALDPSQGRAVSYLGLAYARAGRYAEAYRSFLIAGQTELASEIEVNLTSTERENIHAQLGRPPPPAVARTTTPPPIPRASATPPPVPARSPAPPPVDRPDLAPVPARSPAPPPVDRPDLAPVPARPTPPTLERDSVHTRPTPPTLDRPDSVHTRPTPPPGDRTEVARAATPPPSDRDPTPVVAPRAAEPAVARTQTPAGRATTNPPESTLRPPAAVSAVSPAAAGDAPAPSPTPPRAITPHTIPRSHTPALGLAAVTESRTISEPRTKPPTAPPGSKARTQTSQSDLSAKAAIAVEISKRVPIPFESPEISVERSTDSDLFRVPDELSDSQQFVMPKPDPAAPLPFDGHSMVSMAVAAAAPSPTTATRTLTGALAPRPLSEIATEDLVRPDDGTDAFEVGANGSLLVRVQDRVLSRLDGVHVTGGALTYEIAMRRSRGHQTDERFDAGGAPLHAVSGKGYLIAVPPKSHSFLAIALDDDILYVREDLVFAFESTLRWENGNVPGLRGKLHVVQFRGDGALALRLERPLVRVKLPPAGLVFVEADRLAGWVGRVIPRAVVPPSGGPMGAMCVECTGEGIVLVEPAPDAEILAALVAPAPIAPEPEPAPAPPAGVAPEVADFAAEMAAHSAAEAASPERAYGSGRDEI